jgi:hypothetical protein
MPAVIRFQFPPSTGRLAEAEKRAGVRTRAIREPESTLIDVCNIDTSTLTTDQRESLRSQCEKEIGSKSLSFSAAGGGSLVALSFDEAGLTTKLFEALRKHGYA